MQQRKRFPFIPNVTALAVLVFLSVCVIQAMAQEITPDLYKNLRYRYIGPGGNRTSAVVGVPGDPMVYYIGASSGGIWKSSDGGTNWNPVFDDQDAQSIGSLAIAPSDPSIVWAGTGEPFIRSNVSIGNGIYKSTDAGKTWKHMGLVESGRVAKIVIDPNNPDIVYAAALGHCYGPQQERGVYRTKDGGENWERVLFADENTGCFEIVINPSNPRHLIAGMWALEIKTYGRVSGGPKGGLYMSKDGGDTWEHLQGRGLPASPVGKVGLAFAQSNPDVVYALIETGTPNRGTLWKSSNGGDSWKLTSYDRIINERSHYASRVMVNPADENEVYFAANSQSRSLDGGVTTERVPWAGDCHDMWADPLIPDRMMISTDGVAIITMNRGKTWQRVSLPVAQMYHVAVDNQVPYYVYGGMQDSWTASKGPSTSRGSDSDWKPTAGGECGFTVPDPVNPNIVWGGTFNAGLQRVDYKSGNVINTKVWPESAYGSSAGLLKYRFNWTFPITISPHDHNKVYVGSQHVHVTTDAGHSWKVISPDLSTNDMSRMGPSGGLTKDNLGVEYGCIIFAIAESRLEEGLIWAGTNDGLVHLTRNGGETWTNVTKNIPNLPEWGTISNIEPSRYDAGTAYITVDFHQMNNRDPYIYKTTNYGKSWKFISSTIPKSVFSYVHWVHEDPKREGLLYCGTENAIYVSFNDGQKWLPIQNNLPHAPVSQMVIQEHFNDLVLSTYGRGFYIMDDITPLQQMTDDIVKSEVHLFIPRDTYRMHDVIGGPRGNSTAYINYYLKSVPKGSVSISIHDTNGNLVNTLRGSKNTGINRVPWDITYVPARQVKIRTKPPGNPHVVEEKRFRTTWEKEGWFPLNSWGTDGGFSGIRIAPGNYVITLNVDGKDYKQNLKIMKDPNSAGTLATINEQVSLQLELRDNINTTTDLFNKMEIIRRQLVDLKGFVKFGKNSFEIIKAADELDQKIAEIEDKIVQKLSREGDSKSFRFPNMLYSQLSVLAGEVAEMADFEPHVQQLEVQRLLKSRMIEYGDQWDNLLRNEMTEFNKFLAGRNITAIFIPRKK